MSALRRPRARDVPRTTAFWAASGTQVPKSILLGEARLGQELTGRKCLGPGVHETRRR